ncbi:MAG: hypothetical protein ACK421_07320 [Pseudanabaenaceae cyanobacterium]
MNFLQESIEPDRVQVWEIAYRLRELGINWENGAGDVATAIQIWCVAKAALASRARKIKFLTHCWRLQSGSEMD